MCGLRPRKDCREKEEVRSHAQDLILRELSEEPHHPTPQNLRRAR